MRGVYVSISDLKDVLNGYLDREPTKEKLEQFVDYVKNDTYEWLRDNARAFLRDECAEEIAKTPPITNEEQLEK